jgi:hypothetical protein
MVGLLDIADASAEIEVRGQKVSVTGITARGIAILLEQFPELRKIISGRSDDLTAGKLIEQAPDAVAAAIAAGTGLPGDKVAEEKAANLSLGDQLNLLDAIIRLTFPIGFGPFVERLTSLAGSINLLPDAGGGPSKARATKSPEQSNG